MPNWHVKRPSLRPKIPILRHNVNNISRFSVTVRHCAHCSWIHPNVICVPGVFCFLTAYAKVVALSKGRQITPGILRQSLVSAPETRRRRTGLRDRVAHQTPPDLTLAFAPAT